MRGLVAFLCLPTLCVGQAWAAAPAVPPGAPYLAPPRLQICTTRGSLPNSPISNSVTLAESRLTVTFGQYGGGMVRTAFPAFYVDNVGSSPATTPQSTGGETAMGNTVTWRAAIEKLSAAAPTDLAVPFSVAGVTDVALPGGLGFAMTDPLAMNFGPYEQAKIQVAQSVATGANFLVSLNIVAPADTTRTTQSPAPATQIPRTGAWNPNLNGRVVSVNVGAAPFILCVPTRNYPAAIILGDSILQSTGDGVGDANGNVGFVARGLATADANGNAIPYANLSRAGEYAGTCALGKCASRLSMAPYATLLFTNKGTNDLALGGSSLANVQAALTAEWAFEKATGLRVFQGLIMPRTTSTDNFATTANQTPISGFDVGGNRDQLNTWIKAQAAAGVIDGIFDPNVYVEDQTTKGRWIVNGTASYCTTDGTHPTAACAALAAQSITAIREKFQ